MSQRFRPEEPGDGPESAPESVVAEFHARQQAFYLGGPAGPVEEVLTAGVAWHVPGRNAIAGEYRGRDEVLDYFTRRRALADAAMRMTVLGSMTHGELVVQLVDGRARRHGADAVWSTVGIYRVAGHRVAEGWLVPLDQAVFDAVWS